MRPEQEPEEDSPAYWAMVAAEEEARLVAEEMEGYDPMGGMDS